MAKRSLKAEAKALGIISAGSIGSPVEGTEELTYLVVDPKQENYDGEKIFSAAKQSGFWLVYRTVKTNVESISGTSRGDGTPEGSEIGSIGS
jgi:hypothetical protein